MINRTFFFNQVRATLFTGTLKTKQVEGLNFILDVWEASHASKDDRWLAYALGTAFHETAFTMQPIHEFGGSGYFFRMYDPGSPPPNRRLVAKRLGNTNSGDGVLFHGRGYVQLTGRTNYTNMGKAFGVDLTSSAAAADRVLQPQLAAKIMFKGMEDGTFTSLGFSRFFSGAKEDWKNARKIINGLDCADAIALYGKKFYAAISHTTP
jgi:putative chitinase